MAALDVQSGDLHFFSGLFYFIECCIFKVRLSCNFFRGTCTFINIHVQAYSQSDTLKQFNYTLVHIKILQPVSVKFYP